MERTSAFGAEALSAGAILPYEGRAAMTRGEGLPPAVLEAEHDGWPTPDNPVLVRGRAKILPLAWWGRPDHAGPDRVDPGRIAGFASAMQSAGTYWAGNRRTLDELEERDHADDSLASYLAALRAAGATRADLWRYFDTVGIALVWAGRADAGDASLALHVVPVTWVCERSIWAPKRPAREWRPVRGIDVRWSWSDVIALHEERTRTV